MKKILHLLTGLLATIMLAILLFRLGYIWTGQDYVNGQLTIMARITKNVVKTCHPYTADELKTIPLHMRRTEKCEPTAFPYHLTLSLNEKMEYEETIKPQSIRGDHPMNLQKKIPLHPGNYQMQISLTPSDTWKDFVTQKKTAGLNIDMLRELQSYSHEQNINIEAGKIIFMVLDEDAGQFIFSKLPDPP